MLPLHPASNETPTGPLYRAVWRWHFYAGILVAPFAIFLAITGAIYLWKPQYEAWRYRDLLNVPASATQVPADAQLAAARASVPPPLRAQSYQPAASPGQTAVIVFRPAGGSAFSPGLNVFVDPHTGKVVGQLRDDATLMTKVKNLHGSLLAGKTGKYLVELASSWALVLFLTGLYLAWPRPRFEVWGFLLPRLRATGRTFWRDVHAVPAVWFSLATVFMLSTGLLWTQGAGAWYRKVSAWTGQGTPRESNAGAHRSELTGWSPTLKAGLAEKIDNLASTPPAHDHSMHGGAMVAPAKSSQPDGPYAGAMPLEKVMELAATQGVPQPYVVGLPAGPHGVYSVISDRNQPFRRVYLHLDQYSGHVLADVRFKDFGYLAQFFSWGIIAHEGRLFGLANQILGTLAATGVMLLSASGLVMWWQRKPGRRLKAPVGEGTLPRPVWMGTLLLAAALPLLALSLLILLVGDRWLSSRLRWLQLPQT